MTTAARTYTAESARFYTKAGMPVFEMPKSNGDGMRAPTIADARKLDLLPSVTSILRILDKPELNDWKTEQAVLAVLSTPRNAGEELDGFVHRVLHEERVQDEQAKKAREMGSSVHDAVQKALTGEPYPLELARFVEPVVRICNETGRVVWTERVLVGDGYAGRGDALLQNDLLKTLVLMDFKTCTNLPKKGSYMEHQLQTAAYAATLGNTGELRIATANIYISTRDATYATFMQEDWGTTFVCGFEPILRFWQWQNHMIPGKSGF